MSQDPRKPLRLFVDPFAAWRELAFKTAEMIAASAQAGAARVAAARVVVTDEGQRTAAPKATPAPRATARKKHKKHGKRR